MSPHGPIVRHCAPKTVFGKDDKYMDATLNGMFVQIELLKNKVIVYML